MSDSESPLSSPPDSEDEIIPPSLMKAHTPSSPTPPSSKKPKRKEPPHVPTFSDLPEIAFIVAFQSRFNAAFKGTPNLGCQDIETGVNNLKPSEQVEQLLCRLLGLLLNRKKNVERGHYNRALEEAISANQSQWPPEWEGKNILSGGKSFENLDAKQRLVLLKYLILWSLSSSDVIRAIISENYKTNRRNDDLNVGLSVQPWGRDGDKRRYWLIEGQDDTPFRLFRESNPALKNITWISVAGNIEEIKNVAADLEQHGNKYSTEMAKKIYQAIPRFEDGEHKRKRREYRQQRKNYFTHQAAAFSYEGRTRGKRIKYAFSDESEGVSNNETSEVDVSGLRRSGRVSRADSSAPEGPRFTASGRQIRRPATGPYGESRANDSNATSTGAATPASAGSEAGEAPRARRGRNSSYQMSMDESGVDSAQSNASRDDYEDEGPNDTDDEMSVDDSISDDNLNGDNKSRRKSLVLSLKYAPGGQLDSFLAKDQDTMKPPPLPKVTTNGSTANHETSATEGDAVMQDTSVHVVYCEDAATISEIKPSKPDAPVDQAITKELPVLEARPAPTAGAVVNGTADAEVHVQDIEAAAG